MTKFIILFTLCWGFSFSGTKACTSFLAGKNATTDGSTFITYAADSHTLYGALKFIPAAKYPKNSTMEVREWDTNKTLGRIPQSEYTYKVIGNMNEHQLSITESTWGGRPELADSTGIIDYGSLMFIALQRAKTAREAISVMTDLVKKHGYYSSGESFSIADPGEVWILEMIGKGPQNHGAVWVAIRIPDDCISAHANQARIHKFPLDDKENCLYSPDVISFAREKGYFNGLNKDFSFADAYAPADFGALRGCEARVWSFFNRFNGSMSKYLPYLNGESKNYLPLYIKPDRKLSVQDVKDAMRDHFEGTPFDMTKDVGAGPFKSPYRFRPMTFKVDSVVYTNERAAATQQTGFTLVAQMRSWLPNEIGGILWFGVDDTNTCIYVPMYACLNEVPECYSESNGSMYKLSWTSAFWIHNWVANMAYARYNQMIEDIRPVQKFIESTFNEQQPVIERVANDLYRSDRVSAIRFLNAYSIAQAQQTTAQWKELGEFLLVKYLDGNRKKEKNGHFIENGYGLPANPDFPGYSEEYYRAIAKDAGERLKVSF